MAENIVPITQLDKAGLVADQPPVALPPNAFSDCLNVRFKDGVVKKMEGEVNIFSNDIFLEDDIIKYVAWWPSPNLAAFNSGYYLVIIEQELGGAIRDVAYFIKPGDKGPGDNHGHFSPSGEWQHTFFQGGFALIINNGIDVPQYMLDPEGNEDAATLPMFARLPGWDSYNVNEVILDGAYQTGNSRTFDLGQTVDFALNRVVVEVFTSETDATPIIFANGVDNQGQRELLPTDPPDGPATGPFNFAPPALLGHDTFNLRVWNLYADSTSRTTAVVFGGLDTDADGNPIDNMGLAPGNIARITIRSINPVEVRAGVIRSFGDFLVAGNLSERDLTDTEIVVRSLPGVVRSSDVAAPGAIPNNWNPFAVGVSTADEFVVTQDGIVQDLVELQSNLYIYSNNSISVMRLTGNTAIPLTVVPVTTSYGCLTTEGVLEYDGKHVVVGSQDIYLFGGHPGSIQSIGDGRVRNLLYDRINPLQESALFMLRYQQQDEIWICYASVDSIGAARDEALIWNYRNNTWTRRSLPSIYSGGIGPIPGGGLPSAEIDLNGESSNNLEITPGRPDKQILPIPYALPETGFGTKTSYDIRVNTDFEGFLTDGPISFEIALGSGFRSGDINRTLHMSFTGIREDTTLGFAYSFEVALEPDLSGLAPEAAVTSIIRSLEGETVTEDDGSMTVYPGNADFRANFRIQKVDQGAAPGEFVIVGTNVDAITATLTTGSQRFVTTIGDLTRSMDLDVIGLVSEDDFTPMSNQFLATFVITEATRGEVHYFNFGDTPVDAVPRLFSIDQGSSSDDERDYSDMYDDGSGFMYEGGRGGIPARPRSSDTLDDSQRMYRTASDAVFTEINATEAFIPREIGVYDFFVDYENADAVLTTLTLEAFTQPPSTTGMSFFDPVSGRSGFLSTHPQLTFVTDFFVYDRDGNLDNPEDFGFYIHEVDRTSATTLVGLSGDYTQSGRALQLTDALRDAFHDDAIWTTRVASQGDTAAELISVNNGALRLNPPTLNDPARDAGLLVTDFTPELVDFGSWNWATTLSPIRPLDRLAEGPMFNYSSAGSFPIEMEFTAIDTNTLTVPAGSAAVIATHIEDTLAAHAGWTRTVPDVPGTVTVETDLIVGTLSPAYDALELADLQNVPKERPAHPWIFSLVSRGNIRLPVTNDLTITADPIDGDLYGRIVPTMTVHADDDVDIGLYQDLNTPSYLFLQIRNAEASDSTGIYANQELLILRALDNMSAEDVSNDWVARIRRAAPRLIIRNEGSGGEFSISPNNYGDLANFVLVPSINNLNPIRTLDADGVEVDTGESNLERCKALLRASLYWDPIEMTDRIQLNPASTVPFINLPHIVLTNGYDHFTEGVPIEGPGVVPLFNDADLDPVSGVQGVSLTFDTIRSWPDDEVNFNFEVPIFAARKNILGENQSLEGVNKILGADIGWTTPLFATDDTNDAPQNYESFVERKTLGLTPEFDTEQLSSVALWVDGNTVQDFGEAPSYNRLEIRSAGTNNPGVITDLNLTGDSSQALKKNTYFVSEDYKVDLRTNGRFLNIKITDSITDVTAFATDDDVNEVSYIDTDNDGKEFRKDAEWRLSGVQLELTKTGTR